MNINVIESALHILLHTLLSHMWGRLQLECPTSHHETPEVTGMASDDSVLVERMMQAGWALEYW